MASNNVAAIIPTLLTKAIMVLRKNNITPRLIANYTSEIADKKGSVLQVPVPSAITATDITAAAYSPDAGAVVPTTASVTLDKWKEAAFDLTDKELSQAMEGETIPMQLEEAVKSLIQAVDDSIHALYYKFFGFQGTAGTTPFGSGVGVLDATGIRKVLSNQLAPNEPRHIVLNPDAYAAALGLDALANANLVGSVTAMRDGKLERRLGLMWWENQSVVTHVRNALGAGALTVNGVNTVGNTTLSIAKGAGANWIAKKGDLITIAHGGTTGTKQYVITNDPTVTVVQASNTSVTIYPGLAVATSGGEVITSIDTHVANLAFHRDAFVFAARPFLNDSAGLGNFDSMTDPISGLPLNLEVKREHYRTRWSLSMLWGVDVYRRELGARLLG